MNKLAFFAGLAAGIVCRLTDLLPRHTLLGFQSIATLFGFWIVSITVIVLYSRSNKSAGLNTFIYLFSMTTSFYVLPFILGQFFPRFDNGGFQTTLFIIYSILSAICGVGGYVLYFWNNGNAVSAILYALPVGALAAEVIGVAVYIVYHKEYLFQLLFNFVSFAVIGVLFYKRAKNKIIYCISVLIVTVIIYLIIYKPFLNV